MNDLCPDCGHPNPATNPYCFCGPGRSLIERLQEIPSLTCAEAAAALFEAQATIARQQAMLDRALEDNGGLMIENARLREALREIIDASNNTGIEFASVGMRVAERVEDIARAALSRPHATKGDAG